MAYLSLFILSFLAASILPMSSELTFTGLLISNNYNALGLLSSASLGNILGSVFNWVLGYYLLKYLTKKWFPFKQNQIDLASRWFKKFGLYCLPGYPLVVTLSQW